MVNGMTKLQQVTCLMGSHCHPT